MYNYRKTQEITLCFNVGHEKVDVPVLFLFHLKVYSCMTWYTHSDFDSGQTYSKVYAPENFKIPFD